MKPVVEVPAVPFRQIPQDKENRKEKRPLNYRHETLIEQEVDIHKVLNKLLKRHKVLNKLLKSTTGVSVEELMALSPKLRDTYKECITKKWVATQLHDLQESNNKSEKDELTKIVQVNLSILKDCELEQRELQGVVDGPDRAWVAQDPVTQYLETLPEGERDNQIFVAKEAESLRVIMANINGCCSEEALLDNGSQIISMSREVAMSAHIS
ncbi:hypothetical protein AN958_06268 [Leucoagaricus sp. SymC.cos]|nr:hypothetical protein AN958_06268 [Leucoagaricus sp. SymC.cos]